MRAVVHIGTEKTGTTAIQSLLYANRDRFDAQGFHFVRTPGERNNRWLPAAMISADRTDDFLETVGPIGSQVRLDRTTRFLESFREEMEGLTDEIHTVLISSEHFHSRLVRQEEVNAFGDLLDAYVDEVEIVCYLRPQVDVCVSLYSTSLKVGHGKTLPDFLDECVPESHYYNYDRMLSLWRHRFGRDAMRVRIFDRAELVDGDLVDDFCAQIAPGVAEDLDRDIDDANESLTPAGQAVALAVNRGIGRTTPVRAATRTELVEHLGQQLAGKGEQPEVSEWQRRQDAFVESNEKVRAEYFPERDELFHLKPPVPQPVVVDAAFVSALTDVFSTLMQRVEPQGLPPRAATALRDAAISVESSDRELALKLMEMAVALRPDGPKIKQKLREYRTQVRS